MHRLSKVRPSPAMLVAIFALIAALAGTAFAGVATTSRLNGKDKKVVAKIARKQAGRLIAKRAPKLSVAAAGSADTAKVAATATQLGRVTVQRETGSLLDKEAGSVDALCPAGTQAIGGGARADDDNAAKLIASRPMKASGEAPSDGEAFAGWRASVLNDTGETIQPEAWVVCVG
jgi:hypothetical protein